jgi:hypothetical protein
MARRLLLDRFDAAPPTRPAEESDMSNVHPSRRWAGLAAAAALGLWLGGARPASAQDEAVGFGVDEFTSGDCDWVGATDLNHSAEWADLVDDIFADEGFGQTTKWIDGGVDGRDFTDVSKEIDFGDDDDDDNGADHADVALLVTHGGHVHDAGGYYSEFLMGDEGEGDDWLSCVPNTREHFLLGNGGADDAEIAILAACQSAHYDVWTDGGYFDVRLRDGTFNTWLGFHGNSYDGSEDRNHFENYLEDSFSNGVGDNWLDELYRNPWGSDNEQCPTAVIFCETENDCITQFYFGGFQDRFKVGTSDTKSLSKIFYFGGCNPGAGPTLPN